MFNELKSSGFEIVSVRDLSNKPFLSNDHGLLYNGHPTDEAWKEVTELFSSYTKEKGIID